MTTPILKDFVASCDESTLLSAPHEPFQVSIKTDHLASTLVRYGWQFDNEGFLCEPNRGIRLDEEVASSFLEVYRACRPYFVEHEMSAKGVIVIIPCHACVSMTFLV
jgi:hypothetical protein